MNSGLLTIGLTTLDICAHPIDALTHTERATIIDGIACVPAGTAGAPPWSPRSLACRPRLSGPSATT